MSRKKEFIKESEARILVFLQGAANHMKNGNRMSEKLNIDYVYMMKLLEAMYDKGWVRCHKYNLTTYFDLTKVSPMKEALKRLAKPQMKLGGE